MGILSSALRSTVANQVWRLLSAPLVLFLIPLYLSPESQGYWYTFVSLGALTILADLGFTAIIVQFTAHEFALLRFDERNHLVGDANSLARLSSLFRFALRWSALMALLITPLTIGVGLFVMDTPADEGGWKAAWVLYALASSGNFLFSVLVAFVEGCNRVAEAYRLRLIVSVINVCAVLALLVMGAQLFALALSLALSVCLGLLVLLAKMLPTLRALTQQARDDVAQWRVELLPLLGRYSVSWISGYIILQILAPAAFYFHGPVEAGKIGLSMAIWTAVFSLSSVWLTVAIPSINMQISSGKVAALLADFVGRLRLSVATFCLFSAVFFAAILLAEQFGWPTDRVLPMGAQLVLAIGWCGQLVVSGLAIFVRAHKEEPLMLISVALAIQIGLSTLVLASYGSPSSLVLGFTLGFVVWSPFVYRVFRRYAMRYE